MLFNTRVRLSARDEPEWVSFVPETYTKPNQTKPDILCLGIFSSRSVMIYSLVVSKFLSVRIIMYEENVFKHKIVTSC